MKFVMSTTVAIGVLTLLATGLAEAENKDCTNVRTECRAEIRGGVDGRHWTDREPGGIYAKISACVRLRGCVPLYPRNVPSTFH